MATEQENLNTDPASRTSGEDSYSWTPSGAFMASTYRNTAARLIAVYADRVPLDVTSSIGAPADGRTQLSVSTRPSRGAKAHIAETSARYRRPGDLLGLAALDCAAVRVVTFHEGLVGGYEHTIQQQYDATGDALPGKFDESKRSLDLEATVAVLTEITEKVMDMTMDVPEGVIQEIERVMILAEIQGPPNPSA